MIEIDATEIEACPWPDCQVPIHTGARVVYESTDSRPFHAWHLLPQDPP